MLTGRRVRLRALGAEDLEWLFALATTGDGADTWRMRGRVPSSDRFVEALWHGVESQLVLEAVESGDAFGLVQLTRVDHRNGVASLSAILEADHRKRGWPFEGFLIFVDHVFRHYDLHTLYLEVLDPVFPDYQHAVGRFLDHEGTLRAHQFAGGAFVDMHYLALRRSTWEEHELLVRRIVGDPGG